MTTATKLTPAEMLGHLQEVLTAATEYAASRRRIERLFAELMEHEDDLAGQLPRFENAAHAAITTAVRSLDDDDRTGPEICEEVADAIDVLRFAMERNDAR